MPTTFHFVDELNFPREDTYTHTQNSPLNKVIFEQQFCYFQIEKFNVPQPKRRVNALFHVNVCKKHFEFSENHILHLMHCISVFRIVVTSHRICWCDCMLCTQFYHHGNTHEHLQVFVFVYVLFHAAFGASIRNQ